MRLLLMMLFLFAPAILDAQSVIGTLSVLGLDPSHLVLYDGGSKIAVADSAAKTVHLFDTTAMSPIGLIPIPLGPIGSMVIDDPADRLYLTCRCVGQSKLVIADLGTKTVVEEVVLPAPGTFATLAIDSVRRKIHLLYVGGFQIIDGATGTRTVIPGISGNVLRQMAVNEVTGELFISTMQYNLIDIVDGATGATSSVAGMSGAGVGVNPTVNKVYTVYPPRVLDRATGVITPIQTGNDSTSIYYSTGSNRMYSTPEVNNLTTIIEADDQWSEFPLASTQAFGSVTATKHLYMDHGPSLAVLDEASMMLEFITNTGTPDGSPDSIAVDQALGRVYVSTSGGVRVIQDTARFTRPPLAVVTRYGSGAVLLVDPVTGSEVTSDGLWTLDMDGVATDRSRMYLPNSSELEILTGSGTKTSQALPIQTASRRAAVATPDGSRVYVTGRRGTLEVVDPGAGTAAPPVALMDPNCSGCDSRGLALSPDLQTVYATSWMGETLAVFSTASNSIQKRVPLGGRPWGVAVNSAATKVLVVNTDLASLMVLDAATHRVLSTISVGATPHGVAISPDGHLAFVSNSGENSVSVVSLDSHSVVATVPVTAPPEGIIVTPDGTAAYVALRENAPPVRLARIATDDFSATTLTLQSGDASEASGMATFDVNGRIAGRVTGGGCPVSGALVRALINATEIAKATTDSSGDYSIHNLAPGTYDVEANATGFTPETITAVGVVASGTSVVHAALEGTAPSCRRGDANGDGSLNAADVFYLINTIFADGAAPAGEADADSDGSVTPTDIIFLINHLFAGGPAPV